MLKKIREIEDMGFSSNLAMAALDLGRNSTVINQNEQHAVSSLLTV